MNWRNHLTPDEAERLEEIKSLMEEIKSLRRDLQKEARRIFDRARKREARS